jgi:superfamily II DNA or RNA helicase
MSKIIAGPVRARLEASAEALAAVRQQMRVRDPNAEYTLAYKHGKSDGMVDLTIRGPEGLEFASGLSWRVANAMKIAGFERPMIEWTGLQTRGPLCDPKDFPWRPYQTEGIARALRPNIPRICLECPPRSGKTEIGIEWMRVLGGRTLWVTHLDELIRQTPDRIRERLGIEPIIVQGTRKSNGEPSAPITVGMVQTLSRIVKDNPAYFAQFDNLVMDEAHHAGAPTWQRVADACVNASRRLGLSGTMKTVSPLTDLRIEGALGPTYVVATAEQLAEQEYIAKPEVRLITVSAASYPQYEKIRDELAPNWRKDPQGILGKMGPVLFSETYKRGIINNRLRNQAIVATALRHAESGERFLVLCNRVPHAIALGARIESLTTKPVWVLNGDVDGPTRVAVLNQFKAQEKGGILIATPFFREGVDLPQVDSGFMAGGGSSDIAVWQGFCRMLTIRKGKTKAIVYDFEDPGEHEKDYLNNHFYDRLDLYKRQGCQIVRDW